MVARTRLNVALYVHCVSLYKINVAELSIFLIENKNISTALRNYFESIHSLCCCARISFVSKT